MSQRLRPDGTPEPHHTFMKRCDYCGRDSTELLAGCRECGTPFVAPEPEAPTTSSPLATAPFKSLLTAFTPRTRRFLAVYFAANIFCAMGSAFRGTRSDHFIMLAIVFAPVVLVWCNAYRSIRFLEWLGWVCLFFLGSRSRQYLTARQPSAKPTRPGLAELKPRYESEPSCGYRSPLIAF